MNDKQNFMDQLKAIGFQNSPVQQTFLLNPRYLKDKNGNHHLVGNIHVCIFGGSDTPENALGCVTFYYHTKTKIKGCRNVNDRSELFKRAFVAKSVEHAMIEFKKWHELTKTELNSWKLII
jgi:hypothetical protein